nr:ABC transporter permease [uncultured Mucilaginibacter sp.]
MIKNYIKIALRTLWRDRAYSLINLIGLAVGLASVIMIMAYVRYELSYDKSYSNHPQVYRLLEETKTSAKDEVTTYTSMGLGEVLQREFPVVKNFSSVGMGSLQLKYRDENIKLNAVYGSAGFFKLFNFKFISGNAQTALKEPGSIVLTESAVKHFFTDKNPMGQYIAGGYGRQKRVTGIVQDIPANMHFAGDVIVSDESSDDTKEIKWGYTAMHYILLDKSVDPKKFEASIKSIHERYNFPKNLTIYLQPVTDIHLHSHFEQELMPNGDVKYIYIFLCIAFLILIIACINYVNLTTARSLHRAREIGLRKVLGALKKQLIVQFLTESFLFFICSTLLAVVIAFAAWPVFSAKITPYQNVLPLFDIYLTLGIFLVVVIGGLLAGAYPAFFLSSVQPVKVLRGLAKFGLNISLRKALVVLQFVISGVLIVSTIVVHQQLNYISDARLGFDKDNLISLNLSSQKVNPTTFKNELLKNSAVQGAAFATWNIGSRYGAQASMEAETDSTKLLEFNFIDADKDFISTLGIDLISGRDFSTAFSNDVFNMDSLFRTPGALTEEALASRSIILNQEAVKLLNIKSPVDTVLRLGAIQGNVIGTVANFNGLSLHQQIPAVVIRSTKGLKYGQLFIRISPNNTQKTVAYIESQWKKFYPDMTFEFAFVDDNLQKLYTADRRLGTLFTTFSSLAILIACLGLFGLISLTIQNRVKEIGIRKVMGASVTNITTMLSSDFLRLVALSFVISSPIAWYAMNKWLQSFAYRIEKQWWVFALAVLAAVLIAFATIGYQSIKAALANPVKSLRSE